MKRQLHPPSQFLLAALIRFQAVGASEQGFIVFFIASIIVLLGFIWAAYGLMSQIDSSSTSASVKSNTGFYAAEYGLNLRAKIVRSKFEGYNLPTGTSPGDQSDSWKACTNPSGNPGSGDFICQNTDIQGQTVSTYVVSRNAKNPSTGEDIPKQIPVPVGEPFAGLNALTYTYDVISAAQNGTGDQVTNLADSKKRPTASLKMRFRSLLIPLFQFAVFSENDAEFSLPPDMTLNGPVHGNNSLYLNAAPGNTLTINGQVTVVNTLYRGVKYQNSCSGTVNIYDPGTPKPLTCPGTRQAYNTQSSVDPWNNQILVGAPALKVPQPDALSPVPGKLYWDSADLRIVLKVNKTAPSSSNVSGSTPVSIEIQNQDGTVNPLTNNIQACTPAIATVAASASTSTQIQLASSSILSSLKVGNTPLLVGNQFDSLVAIGPDVNNTGLVDNGSIITIRKAYSNPLTLSNSPVRRAILSSSDTFFNYREKFDTNTGSYTLSGPNAGRFIRMLNVDMQGLIDCVQTQSLMGSKTLNDSTNGGLVWYFTVAGPDSNAINNYGVRLYEGSSLHSKVPGAPQINGLTVISDQAIYIQGDYNSANKIPAAILTDSLNILSNNWTLDDKNSGRFKPNGTIETKNNGSKVAQTDECVGIVDPPSPDIGCKSSDTSPANLLRVASPTTINAAFLSGLEIPGGSNGAGSQDNGIKTSGVHNYPRLQENWGEIPIIPKIPLNYLGSLVALSVPLHVSSPFCGSLSTDATCNIYSPPFRNWDYDTAFNDAANLPPLTPQAVFLKQDAFSRNFDVASVDVYRGLPGLPNLTRLGINFPALTGVLSVSQP